MQKVSINQFNGGLDEDVRSHNTTTFKDVKGFDTLTYKHRLTPFGETESEALSSGDITDKRITDVVRDSSGFLAYLGRNSTGSPNVTDLLSKDSGTDVSDTITAVASDSGAAYAPNSFQFYRGSYYYLQANGSGNLRRVVSGTWSTSTLGSVGYTSYWTDMPVPRPFIHPADDILYVGLGNKLAKVDNTTFSTMSLFALPENYFMTSLTDYGNDLAISAMHLYEGGKSYVYIYDQNTASSTFRNVIDWGEGSLLIVENLGGTLIGISTSESNLASTASYDLVKTKKIYIKAYSGGQVVTLKELVVDSVFELRNFKAKQGDKLFFGGNNGDALYVVKKNSDGTITVSKDRYINNGSAYTTLKGFGVFGDYLIAMFDTAGQSGNVYRTKVTSSYTNTSVYETNINPKMPLEDRVKQKKLNLVSVSTSPLPSGASVTVKYSVDGSAYETLFTESTDGRISTHTTKDSSNLPLLDGYEYQFKVESTGGAEITELRYQYEVIDQSL